MCGIVGYVGGRPCRDLLIAGLQKLEYRGYDSAGISLLVDGRIETVRAVGNLANLRRAVTEANGNGAVAVADAPSTIGLAHTRWATHGRVTEQNAHPHGDCEDRIHIVLNGIVENHADLRRELEAEGHRFSSETDAEIVAHLIERHDDGDLTEAVRRAFNDLRGHYAFAAMHSEHPGLLVAARRECPLIVGLGEGETFVASAIPAFLAQTRKVTLVENGEIVTLDSEGVAITDTGGQPVSRDVEEVTWDEDAAEKSDTLAAMRLARERGAKVMAITNIMGSQATRDSDAVLYTRAGLEIGVAATKTFVSQVAAMYLFGLWLADARGGLDRAEVTRLIAELRSIPSAIERLLETVDERVRAIARSHHEQSFFLYLGRNIGLPVCLEGALKLREISYIPTDAYAAGEMKHGPIALLDDSTPVVCVATDSPVLEKVLSNVAEVRARGADVIAVATEGSEAVAEFADQVLLVPRTDWVLQPVLAIVPLQLLAYHVARLNGLNVDQPRNLAKTVTVE